MWKQTTSSWQSLSTNWVAVYAGKSSQNPELRSASLVRAYWWISYVWTALRKSIGCCWSSYRFTIQKVSRGMMMVLLHLIGSNGGNCYVTCTCLSRSIANWTYSGAVSSKLLVKVLFFNTQIYFIYINYFINYTDKWLFFSSN